MIQYDDPAAARTTIFQFISHWNIEWWELMMFSKIAYIHRGTTQASTPVPGLYRWMLRAGYDGLRSGQKKKCGASDFTGFVGDINNHQYYYIYIDIHT